MSSDPSPKRLSSGILVINEQAELLLCHVTGHGHWDLPKGGLHDDETPQQAALRETREETGLVIDDAGLVDLGRFTYRAKKDLHLFAVLMTRFDVAQLHCDSHFSQWATGRQLPEMDDFQWVEFGRVPQLTTPKMAAVLAGRIGLAQVLDTLRQRQPAVALA